MGEQPFRIESCRSCYRPIIWAITERAKRMPVDPEPTKGGNIQLDWRPGGAAPLARVLPVAKQFGKTNLRKSHFATCPNAARHRAAGKGRPS